MITKTLRFIVAIVDEGGLSRAAEALYLSQPALSRYLKRTEEALGTPVFYREHSGLTLTAAGKVFINGARSMLHLEQEALQQIQASRQDRSASVSIAAQSLFLPFLDKAAQGTFKEQYPSVTIKLTEQSGSQVRNLISNGTVDLGFFYGRAIRNSLFFPGMSLYVPAGILRRPQDAGANPHPEGGLSSEPFRAGAYDDGT